jgi:N-acetylated-alpha-linked acidic dipeptidase
MKSLLFCFLSILFSFAIKAQQKLMGFTDANAAKQIDWEKQFDAQLNPQNLDTWMKFLSSHPHHVGSPQGKANADYMAGSFQAMGLSNGDQHVLCFVPNT